jgi:hypothetical protein
VNSIWVGGFSGLTYILQIDADQVNGADLGFGGTAKLAEIEARGGIVGFAGSGIPGAASCLIWDRSPRS